MSSTKSPFYIGETTIGIKGSDGTVFVGMLGDVCCHIELPDGHWIFKTEPTHTNLQSGKNGMFEISRGYGFSVPFEITFWNPSKCTIGWFSYTYDLVELVSQFKAMGEWLNSETAKAEFDKAYGEEQPAPVKRTWAQVVASQ